MDEDDEEETEANGHSEVDTGTDQFGSSAKK
jgi:hypothetical protein